MTTEILSVLNGSIQKVTEVVMEDLDVIIEEYSQNTDREMLMSAFMQLSLD